MYSLDNLNGCIDPNWVRKLGGTSRGLSVAKGEGQCEGLDFEKRRHRVGCYEQSKRRVG
jgi:hypothetical protein